MDAKELIFACKTRKLALARELAAIDPIEDESVTSGRLKMRMLDGLQERAMGGAVDLSDDERRLLDI